jgi:AcrR family transcriptional regulator
VATTARTGRRRTQQQRTEATTGQLLEAARGLFADDGYAATSLDAIAARAKVTKGAVYHHFPEGKAALYEAVFRKEQEQLCEELAVRYAKHQDPLAGANAAFRAFLEASCEPGVQRITLLDAPAVLGWERMRAIEADYGLALLKEGIKQAIAAGRIRRRDVDPLAHLLFGALCEGAMYVAGSEDQQAAKRKIERELKVLLDALAAA